MTITINDNYVSTLRCVFCNKLCLPNVHGEFDCVHDNGYFGVRPYSKYYNITIRYDNIYQIVFYGNDNMYYIYSVNGVFKTQRLLINKLSNLDRNFIQYPKCKTLSKIERLLLKFSKLA